MSNPLHRLRRTAPLELATEARDRLSRLLGGPAAGPTGPKTDETGADETGADKTGADAVPTGPLGSPVLLDPARRGALALAGVALLATVVTGGLVWRSRPRPVTLLPPTVVPSAGVVAAEVVIDVQGAVRRPGLVTLPGGARVADAIAAAGGMRPGATTAGLNLARRLTDGEQVVVLPPGATPAPSARSGAESGVGSGSRLDLNLATLEQLDALPGVGPVTARRILAWRAEHGRFATVDQLREIEGIGDKRFESLRELVVV